MSRLKSCYRPNGANFREKWQKLTIHIFFAIKTTLLLRCGHVAYYTLMRHAPWYSCNRTCASLKTQRVIWICVQVRTGWVYRGFARHGTHFYAHDFVPFLGFLFVQCGIYIKKKKKKKKKNKICLSVCLSGYTFRHAWISHADILDIDRGHILGSIGIKITKKLLLFTRKRLKTGRY